MGNTFRRWYRSSRNVPRAIDSSRLRCVAAMMRTLQRHLARGCRRARIRAPAARAAASPAWSGSCRRSRRGTACRPRRSRSGPCARRSAPVKAPFSWPNSSDSSSSAGNGAAVDRDERARCGAGSSRGWRARRLPCRCRTRRASVRWSRVPATWRISVMTRGWRTSCRSACATGRRIRRGSHAAWSASGPARRCTLPRVIPPHSFLVETLRRNPSARHSPDVPASVANGGYVA